MDSMHEGTAGDSTLEPMVRNLEYFHKFTPADRSALLALPHTTKRAEANAFLVREFDRAERTNVVLSGFAIRSKIVATGHRQIVSIHMAGEVVDLQNSMLGVADHSVQMLTGGEVALIARKDIEEIAYERPAIGKAMWLSTLVDGSIFREWITNVGRRDAATRIAHLFCEFALRMKVAGLGNEGGYELPMTQEQLADATGLTSVHVNRTIKSLQAAGLIQRPSPRSIVIGDWRKLAAAGDFNSNYLHLHEGDPALAS